MKKGVEDLCESEMENCSEHYVIHRQNSCSILIFKITGKLTEQNYDIF